MSDGVEEWLCDSNEALDLQMVRAQDDAALLQGADTALLDAFNPQFTYPIFGEREVIFGYKDLSIQLQFASGSLKQYLAIEYSDKLESEATPADDIEATLYQFIPPDYTKSDYAFAQSVEADAKAFKPLGEKLGSYVRRAASAKGKGKAQSTGTTTSNKGKGKSKANGAGQAAINEPELDENDPDAVVYEMYKTTWDTPGFREYHRRMQLFILLFIEGGSYVHEDEDRWEFLTLFERRRRPDSDEQYTYHFVGYTSVYPFWCYPEHIRLRLSQFVILPPYQNQGHGSKLYSCLYQHCLSRPDVAELTVEDPAEAFEDLRDRNDLRYLVAQGVPDDPLFLQGVGDKSRSERAKWETDVRKKHKLAGRQFDRLLEMLLLKQLDRKDADKVRAYRLHVKARLYRFNYEMLSQMSAEERKEALAKTYDSVVEDYDRILDMTFH